MWLPSKDKDGQFKLKTEAFAAKTVIMGGEELSLYKRIRGNKYEGVAAGGVVTNLDFIVPYPVAKIEAIEIINGALGDCLTFEVLLAANDMVLNTFGEDVFLDKSGYYEQRSQYDADVTDALKFRIKYTNNDVEKDIYINYVLNEVK